MNLNQQLSGLGLEEVLAKICELYPDNVVFSTSLGQEDQVITHAIFSQNLPIKVFTLDTGRLFPETYELIDNTRSKYQKNIEVYFPNAEKVQDLTTQKGFFSFYQSIENRKECCHVRKIEPLNRALAGAKIWITGIRADQSENRQNMEMVEWDEHRQLYKLNPIIDWSLAQVEEYLSQNKIPQNSLHKSGFVSIGCGPCTRAISAGEDIRAGRWWWEQSKKECGLHA